MIEIFEVSNIYDKDFTILGVYDSKQKRALLRYLDHQYDDLNTVVSFTAGFTAVKMLLPVELVKLGMLFDETATLTAYYLINSEAGTMETITVPL